MHPDILAALPKRLSFSQELPTLQLAWDSTSMGALKTCPRYYEYNILLGWSPRETSVHLTFGLHYHSALEAYDHAKAAGADHEEATRAAVRKALQDTWDRAARKPWLSDSSNKNRLTLVRSVVWYLEQFADDPCHTIILANGKPAVELSFRYELPFEALTGEPLLSCGHMDRLVEWNDHEWVLDRKTTQSTIGPDFFSKFSPDNQFSTYQMAAQVVLERPTRGLIVDGAQIAVGFTRFQRGIVEFPKGTLEEFLKDLGFWLQLAGRFAEEGYWPKNEKSCANYGGCPYRGICSKAPVVREQWLKANFHKRVWDPLQVRGDI